MPEIFFFSIKILIVYTATPKNNTAPRLKIQVTAGNNEFFKFVYLYGVLFKCFCCRKMKNDAPTLFLAKHTHARAQTREFACQIRKPGMHLAGCSVHPQLSPFFPPIRFTSLHADAISVCVCSQYWI